jgi:HSP20 family protein
MAVKSVRSSKQNAPGSPIAQGADLLLESRDFLDPFAVGSWTPPVDICQTESRVRVRIELPGVDISDILLSFKVENLRIQGVKREQVRSPKLLCFYCLERRYGRFDRQIAIKGVLNPRKSRAYLENGVLTVEIPKIKDKRGAVVDIPIGTK